MSGRGRSGLFGRPGELLVDETAPRIAMPAPPLILRAPDVVRVEPPPAEDTDEEEAPSMGPLRVFVGPPTPVEGREPAARPPEVRLPSHMVTVLPEPPRELHPSASIDELESPFEERVQPPSTPGVGVHVSVRTGDRASRTEVLPEPPVVRQRGQGIATAAARARATRVELPPRSAFDEEENTSLTASRFDGFDALGSLDSGPSLRTPDAPPWDDPRFRRPEPAETARLDDVRIPPPPPGREAFTNEPTQPNLGLATPGDSVVGGLETVVAPERTEEVAKSQVAALPQPSLYGRPVPAAPPRAARWKPSRRLVGVVVLTSLVVGLGLVGLRWERAQPGALAARWSEATAAISTRLTALMGPQDASAPPVVAPAGVELAGEPWEGGPVTGAAAAEVPATTEPALPLPADPPAPEPVPVPVVVAAVPAPVPVPAAPVVPNVAERRGSFQQATGFLRVVCDRKATIYVDNVRKGSTSDTEPLELVAGAHRVKVVANGRSRSMNVRIDAGRLSMVQFELR